MEQHGALYPYALVTHLLGADITIANLEGALTERGESWPKGYNFRTPPRFASGLRDAGFDLVSLANNHTMDYGAVGLTDTLASLDAVGVRRVGAGASIAEASAFVVVEAPNGLRVAFIGCADSPTESGGFAIRDWAATPTTPGLMICDDASLAAAVSSARESADFVIVTPHAGDEYRTAPNATQRRIAATALAAGADAYIGHHAHVVQPVEQRGGQLIAWGLGNFIFDLDEVDLANIPQPRVTPILKLTLTKGAGVTSFEVIAATQDANEDRPRPATPEEAAVLNNLITP
jgi:poly-gamma-glutamate synthesis protein (capsule biosynthesis protein)